MFFSKRKRRRLLNAASEQHPASTRVKDVHALDANGSNGHAVPTTEAVSLTAVPTISTTTNAASDEDVTAASINESGSEVLESQGDTTNFEAVAMQPCRNPVIVAALQSMQTLRAFVDNVGGLYYVPDPRHARSIERLSELIKQQLGNVFTTEITLIEYSRMRRAAVQLQRDDDSRNDLVDLVLREAIEKKASDVYVAIQQHVAKIYFRTHGVRYMYSEISREDAEQMVRSLWNISKRAAWEQHATVDTSFTFENRRIRANSLPETRGNSVVLRIRDPSFCPPVAELGYDHVQRNLIDNLNRSAGGLAVISGETNSGKSTTLTSLMTALPDSQMIIEIADPIEIEFGHVTHVELDHYGEDADASFRSILGGLVRQNPDTLFIGEIRDRQSAQAAIDMSLQGKLVWGTVHSHSCITTIARLHHLGIDYSLLSQPSFLNGVVNQSLVPLVCQRCATDKIEGDDVLTSKVRRKFKSDNLRFHNPDGCSECIRGVRGQTVVAEVMALPREPDHLALEHMHNGDLGKLTRVMRDIGMRFKDEHAIRKIQQGLCDPFLTESIIGQIGTKERLPSYATQKGPKTLPQQMGAR